MRCVLKFKYFRLLDGQEEGEGEEGREDEWEAGEGEEGIRNQILDPTLYFWSSDTRRDLKDQGEKFRLSSDKFIFKHSYILV